MPEESENTEAAVNQDKKPEHDIRDLDPRDTNHPTGTVQAAENAASDSPG